MARKGGISRISAFRPNLPQEQGQERPRKRQYGVA
jgi:hypothetical protein